MTNIKLNDNTADIASERVYLSALLAAGDFGVDPLAIMADEVAPGPALLMADPVHQSIWGWLKGLDNGSVPTTRNARLALRDIPGEIWDEIERSYDGGALDRASVFSHLTTVAARRNTIAELLKTAGELAGGAEPVDATAALTGRLVTGIQQTRSHTADEYASGEDYYAAKGQGQIEMVEIGIPCVDERQGGGLGRGQIGLLIGRTGQGKTRTGIGIAVHTVAKGNGGVYMSGEQTETDEWADPEGVMVKSHQITAAFEGFAAGVRQPQKGQALTDEHRKRMRQGRELILAKNAEMGERLFRVFDDRLTLGNIRNEAMKAALRGDRWMIIDNLEHVEGDIAKGENHALFLEKAVLEIARIAKESRLAVWILVQTRLDANASVDEPPQETDIANSRGITKAAHRIISFTRDAKAAKETYYRSRGATSTFDGKFRLIKARDAAYQGVVDVSWNEHLGRWYDPTTPAAVTYKRKQESTATEGKGA